MLKKLTDNSIKTNKVIFIRAYLVESGSEEIDAPEDLKSIAGILFDERLHEQGGKPDFGRYPIKLIVGDDKRRLGANQIPSIKKIGDEVYLSFRPGGIILSNKGITVYEKTRDGERVLERSVGSRTVDLEGVLEVIESFPPGTELYAIYNSLETIPSEIFTNDGKKIVFSDGFGEEADLSSGSQEEGNAIAQRELAAEADTGMQGTEMRKFKKVYTVKDVGRMTGISRPIIRKYSGAINNSKVNFSEFLRLVLADPPRRIKNTDLAAELGFDEQGLREYLGVDYNPLEVRRPLKSKSYTPRQLAETVPMKEIGATKNEIKDVAINLLYIEPYKHTVTPKLVSKIYRIPGDLVSGRLEEIIQYIKEKRAQQ